MLSPKSTLPSNRNSPEVFEVNYITYSSGVKPGSPHAQKNKRKKVLLTEPKENKQSVIESFYNFL